MSYAIEVKALQTFGPDCEPPDWMLVCVTGYDSAILLRRSPGEGYDTMRHRANAIVDAQMRSPDTFRDEFGVRMAAVNGS